MDLWYGRKLEMTVVFRHTLAAKNFAGGVDVILGDCPLPMETSQLQVWGELHVVNREANPMEWDTATMYGTEGRVIDVADPDTALDVETLWDNRVPKDADVASGVFDLDPATTNAGGFFEVGEPNIDALMGMSDLQPNNLWWTNRKILSWANNRVGLTAGTPDTYVIADLQKIRSTKRVTAEDYCWSLFAVGMPSFGDVDAARLTYESEALWMQTKYMDVVLEQAWMELVGLTEAGAETPWTDAALAIQRFVEPEPVFATASATANFNDTSMFSWCEMTFQVEVPGRKEVGVISGGRGAV